MELYFTENSERFLFKYPPELFAVPILKHYMHYDQKVKRTINKTETEWFTMSKMSEMQSINSINDAGEIFLKIQI